jgi:lipid-A-disaccharide synthase
MGMEPMQFADPEAGERVDVLFVAGEHSGDQHAALIARDLKSRHPEWGLYALGGPSLLTEGVPLLHDMTRHAVVGLVEVIRHYGLFKAIMVAVLDWIERNQPQVVVLVDYPGFNLRLARALRQRGLSRKGGGNVAVYQYVSPQIWAWKAGRRFKMAQDLDELGTIFPFEPACYEDTLLPAHFVGHPFARGDYQNPLRHDPEGPILLLPGSRAEAVRRIFPILLETVRLYREAGGCRRCVCLYPDDSIRAVLEGLTGQAHLPSDWIHFRSASTGTTASVVLSSSGTMSLNCALAGLPGAIIYRAHPLTILIGRRLVRVKWLGMANLILGREVYPEYIQADARPSRLKALLEFYLEDVLAAAPFAAAAEELRAHLQPTRAEGVCDRIESLLANR